MWILRPTEREVKWLKKLVQINQLQGGTFIDIGAHLGMYSLTLSNIFSKCLAIEANPSLCEEMQISGLPKNVIVENLAISNVGGQAELRMPILKNIGLANLGEATIEPSNNFQGGDNCGFESINVKCVTLDSIVQEKYNSLVGNYD